MKEAFPDCGPLAEDSAIKLKMGPAKCVLCMCTMYDVLFSPTAAEICAGLAISVSN